MSDDNKPNLPEMTVSEISGGIKKTLETTFDYVRVRGELGRVTVPRSGHLYADLKDDKSTISIVMFKNMMGSLSFNPEQGLEVIAEGRISAFSGQSKYQLIAKKLLPAGEGALMALLEKRKIMLKAEGLFDTTRKKPLPFLPRTIGVVTSPTGAVIRDILHRLRDRMPARVIVWPALVQGENAAPQVARGIAGLNALQGADRPDVIIVARGGGSFEDLWAFNEEAVVRAAAASDIPLVSAIGHETDTTLLDMVADMRAPTPTGAAEIVVPVREELLAYLQQMGGRSKMRLLGSLEEREKTLAGLDLPPVTRALMPYKSRLDLSTIKLKQAPVRTLQTAHRDLIRARLTPNHIKTLIRNKDRAFLAASGDLRAVIGQPLVRASQALMRVTLTPSHIKTLIRNKDRAFLATSANLRVVIGQPLTKARLTAQDVFTRFRPQLVSDDIQRKSAHFGRVTLMLRSRFDARILVSKNALQNQANLLQALSYWGTLARGYAILRDSRGGFVRSQNDVTLGQVLEAEVADGSILKVEVKGEGASKTMTKSQPMSSDKSTPKLKPAPKKDGQGQLI